MKIVIDIDEEYYEIIKHDVNVNHNDFKPYNIIATGTPLPKEHGRLIDEKIILGMANKDLNWVYDLSDMPDYIAGLPAVIPAESEE